MFFGRKKSKVTQPTPKETLAAKPLRLIEPDIEPTKDGGAHLKVRLRPRKMNAWFFKVPDGATKTFELDAVGLSVWNQCDGKTTIRQIIRSLASTYGLNEREAQVSTQVFLRTLMKKGLIGIPVHKPSTSAKRK